MPTPQFVPILRYLRRLKANDDHDDRELLNRFVAHRDPAAFEALLRRHGPLVLGVCRRVLSDAHAAEDAFQATFLVLVRRASTLRQPERLGPWLYGVALRTARQLRSRGSRLRGHASLEGIAARTERSDPELSAHIDDAVARLPKHYRIPFILCCVQGRTQAQAAALLGCPPGTIAVRLSRARQRLRVRLSRQGFALTAGALSGLAAAAPSQALAASVSRSALQSLVSLPVATFMEGVCRAMMLWKGKAALTLALTIGLIGVGFVAFRAPAADRPSGPTRGTEPTRAAADAEPVVVETANFRVTAPTRRVAQVIADAAEAQREAQAIRWLGKVLPNWSERCSIEVDFARKRPSCAEFEVKNGDITRRSMLLTGPLDRMLTSALPRETTFCVLADHFRGFVPRWAELGPSLLAETEDDRAAYERPLPKALSEEGRVLPLAKLLPLEEFGQDYEAFCAQTASLTRFLVERKNPPMFITFVDEGRRIGWDKAIKACYGFRDVAALEAAWLASVRGVTPPKPAERPEPEPASGVALPDGRNLPARPGPSAALALPDGKGRITIWTAHSYYEPVTSYRKGADGSVQEVTSYELREQVISKVFKLDELHAYGSDGKEIAGRALLDQFGKEAKSVLVSTDGRKVDAFYLNMLKSDTLILVLPLPRAPISEVAPPPVARPPAAPPSSY
jgi:RNA polymerase sigma factor (sigma-70 family)